MNKKHLNLFIFDIEIFFPKTLGKLVEFTFKSKFLFAKNEKIC